MVSRGSKNGHQKGHHVFSKGRNVCSNDVNDSSSLVNMNGGTYRMI